MFGAQEMADFDVAKSWYDVILHYDSVMIDLKMCDTDYRYVTDLIFRHSRLSDILSCDKPCRINGF